MNQTQFIGGREQTFHALKMTGEAPRKKNGCILAPIKQMSDVDAVLAYAAAGGDSEVHLVFLHVMLPEGRRPDTSGPGFAELLLEYAEARSFSCAVAQESYVLAGDPLFSILDAAQLLACDAIVMPARKSSPWHWFFHPNLVRKIEECSPDVPLILIDSDGAVARSKRG